MNITYIMFIKLVITLKNALSAVLNIKFDSHNLFYCFIKHMKYDKIVVSRGKNYDRCVP